MSTAFDMEQRCAQGPSMVEFNFFGEGARFHHLGMVVRSIREVSPRSEPITDPIQRVVVAFVRVNGFPLELIEPCGEDSPVARSLEEGLKLLHVCYAVPDLMAAIETCRTFRFRCIQRPVSARAFGDASIAWVYSNQYGLFELCEGSGAITTEKDVAGEILTGRGQRDNG